ncbi:MAG: response regulator, partial [Verrucomicrobiales bacterium]|nr:response regulator [Verrucomicrobiales bacterium]
MRTTPIRVLVVDDEPAHQQAIRRALEDATIPYQVSVAGSLLEYRMAIAANPPDLVILDRLLPDGRAESVLTHPPESGRFPQVVMTSHGDEHVAVGAIQSGALDYVVKSPESFAQMPHVVERALRTWSAISERKAAVASLRESEQRLRLAMEAAQMGAWEHDVSTGHLSWSESNPRLTGFAPGTFPGTEAAFRELIHPDSREIYAAALHRACQGDGLFQAEIHFRLHDGRERWGLIRGRAVRDADGGGLRILGVDMDITERKTLEAQFLRAQRLEGIGSLASGVAHDLNNIFAPILMTLPLLRDSLRDSEDAAMLETVEACAQRGAEITRQLLTFARGAPDTRVPLPVRHLLRELEKLMRETFPRDIRLVLDLDENLGTVQGDPTQFHQALMNLCINSRDAMPEGGALRISARNVVVDEGFVDKASVIRPGPHVCVRVTDTGSGIPAEYLDRIFDPFFTTKAIGKGTGLGLASVLGIVRGHDGFVRVTSEPGQGATFELYFPSAESVASFAESEKPAIPRGRGEWILLVDDEAAVRVSMQRTLETLGYRILAASQGAEALTLFAQNRQRIRALVTDMMMPIMGGPALIQAVRELAPALPILGMTGLPESQSIRGLNGFRPSALLIKPFTIEELARAISAALEAASSG